MNTIGTPVKRIATQTLLSTLWIVVVINMLKADILSSIHPRLGRRVGQNRRRHAIPLLMLGGAIMMQVSTLMILFSRVLAYRLNRWVNIVTSIITIAFIVGGAASYPHYLFLATVEVVCLLLIVWFAWQWRNLEA
jgi:ABC-type Fe3+-siderophore transport system permease subunit